MGLVYPLHYPSLFSFHSIPKSESSLIEYLFLKHPRGALILCRVVWKMIFFYDYLPSRMINLKLAGEKYEPIPG